MTKRLTVNTPLVIASHCNKVPINEKVPFHMIRTFQDPILERRRDTTKRGIGILIAELKGLPVLPQGVLHIAQLDMLTADYYKRENDRLASLSRSETSNFIKSQLEKTRPDVEFPIEYGGFYGNLSYYDSQDINPEALNDSHSAWSTYRDSSGYKTVTAPGGVFSLGPNLRDEISAFTRIRVEELLTDLDEAEVSLQNLGLFAPISSNGTTNMGGSNLDVWSFSQRATGKNGISKPEDLIDEMQRAVDLARKHCSAKNANATLAINYGRNLNDKKLNVLKFNLEDKDHRKNAIEALKN